MKRITRSVLTLMLATFVLGCAGSQPSYTDYQICESMAKRYAEARDEGERKRAMMDYDADEAIIRFANAPWVGWRSG